jgi:hypothetical protein
MRLQGKQYKEPGSCLAIMHLVLQSQNWASLKIKHSVLQGLTELFVVNSPPPCLNCVIARLNPVSTLPEQQ